MLFERHVCLAGEATAESLILSIVEAVTNCTFEKIPVSVSDDDETAVVTVWKSANSPIVIRNCYPVFYNIWKQMVTLCEGSNPPGVLIIGSPGTGKSCFLLYALHRALADGMTVIFRLLELDKDIAFYRDSAGLCKLPLRSALCFPILSYQNVPGFSSTAGSSLRFTRKFYPLLSSHRQIMIG